METPNKKNSTSGDQSIGVQLEFAVLAVIASHPKAHCNEGVRLDDILPLLEGIKENWENRKDGGRKFKETVAWTLSNLYEENSIGKVPESRNFLWIARSEPALLERVTKLNDCLALDLEFGFDGLAYKREEKIAQILNHTADIEVLSKSRDGNGELKERIILTTEFTTLLAKLAVEHNIYE
ncbi:hypothetical protein [Sporosarcina sp. ITBMC105]